MKRREDRVSTKQAWSAQDLQNLVDELMKDRPDQRLVRQMMLKQGLAYTPDPIAQMSMVLQRMNQNTKAKDSVSL